MEIAWTPALAVGVEEIDAQHRELFERAGRLIEAVQAKKPRELGALINYLHVYAVAHFGAEEELMRARGFPGYVRHKAEHDRFTRDLLGLADEYERRGAQAFVSTRASRWLETWLRDHVSGTDAELARFLARKTG